MVLLLILATGAAALALALACLGAVGLAFSEGGDFGTVPHPFGGLRAWGSLRGKHEREVWHDDY